MKDNNFDLLRFFAALQVVIVHTHAHILLEHGYEVGGFAKLFLLFIFNFQGVPIFFLISGFLISMSYEKNSNLVEYIKNRILRIYPALFVNIFLSVAILFYFGYIDFNFEFLSWLIAQMTIVQFFNPEMFRGFGVGVINGSLWTISVELCFYIVLPIIFYIFKKARWIIILFFIISFVLWLYDLESDKVDFYNKLLHVTIIPYFFLFIVGFYFYKYFEKIMYLIENKSLLWISVFLIFNYLISYLHIEFNILLYIIKWIIFSFMIFSFAFSYKTLSRKLLKGDDYTYGIYIYHMIIINIFVHFSMVAQTKYFFYVILGSIVLGMISWHIIERPFLKMKNHSLFKQRENI